MLSLIYQIYPSALGIINKTTSSLDVVNDNTNSFNTLNYIIVFLFMIIIISLGNMMFSKR